MKISQIKSNWASVNITRDNEVIVCTKYHGKTLSIEFRSIDKLKQVIDRRKLVVKKWAISIPRNLCILKPLLLPASDLSEAMTMVEFELPAQIPLPINEIVYGTTLLGKQNNMLNILLCVLKLNTLQEYIKPLTGIGIKPHRITLDSLAIHNWIINTIAVGSEPVISVILDRGYCLIHTSIDKYFQKDNSLNYANVDIHNTAENIIAEMLFQKEELDVSIRERAIFVIIGIEQHVAVVSKLLRSSLPDSSVIKTITIIPEQDVLYYNGEEKFLHQDIEISRDIIASTGLLDLALNGKQPESNLVPQQYTKKIKQRTLLKKHILTGSLVVIFILFIWLTLFASNLRLEKISEMIEFQITPIEDVARTVEVKRERVQAIQAQLSHRGQITAILKELYRITPGTISINKLKYTSGYLGSYIDIEGQADTMETAYKYNGKDNAQLLGQLQCTDAQQIQQAGNSIVVFDAHCDIQDK